MEVFDVDSSFQCESNFGFQKASRPTKLFYGVKRVKKGPKVVGTKPQKRWQKYTLKNTLGGIF